MNTFFQSSLILAALAAGLSGGITFAFSNFVMRALDRLPTPEAIRAMQAINETVINPLFLLVFIGTGIATGSLGVVQWLDGRLDPWLAAGAAVYLLGVVLVTLAGNVPLNDALAEVDPVSPTADWSAFARPWLRWNHLRTAAAVLAAALFVLGAAA